MNPELLRPGTVIVYPYLWKHQQSRGETEGRKGRPVCMILAVKSADGATHMVLLAISTKPPIAEQSAIEVPETEHRRAGIGEAGRCWITVSEYNYDIVEDSFYLDPAQQPLGRFSRSFVTQLAAQVAPLFRDKKGQVRRR